MKNLSNIQEYGIVSTSVRKFKVVVPNGCTQIANSYSEQYGTLEAKQAPSSCHSLQFLDQFCGGFLRENLCWNVMVLLQASHVFDPRLSVIVFEFHNNISPCFPWNHPV